MKSVYTFFLLLILSFSTSLSQTYDPNPISIGKTIAILDLCTYKDKAAIVASVLTDKLLQVYLFKDNKWNALPNKIIENGIERTIKTTSEFEYHHIYTKSGIEFDSKGNIWVNGFDGIYRFDTTSNQWLFFTLSNVNKEFTRFKNIRIDSLDNLWTVVDVYRGNATTLGDSTNIGDTNFVHFITKLNKFRDGQFDEIQIDSNSSPLNFVFDYPNHSVINNTPLKDGIMLRNFKSTQLKDLVHVKSDGSISDYQLPTTDLDKYTPIVKYNNYIFNDKKIEFGH